MALRHVRRRLSRNARTYQITLADGTTQTFTTDDPGRLLLTGQIADLGVMDVTNLRGVAKTLLISTITRLQRLTKCSTTTALFSSAWRD